MGNTLPRKGFGRFEPAGLILEVSQIIVHEASQPDSVLDLFEADRLVGKDEAEIDLPRGSSSSLVRDLAKSIIQIPINCPSSICCNALKHVIKIAVIEYDDVPTAVIGRVAAPSEDAFPIIHRSAK